MTGGVVSNGLHPSGDVLPASWTVVTSQSAGKALGGIFAAPGEQAGGRSGIDVCNQQALLTLRLVAEKRPIRPHHR